LAQCRPKCGADVGRVPGRCGPSPGQMRVESRVDVAESQADVSAAVAGRHALEHAAAPAGGGVVSQQSVLSYGAHSDHSASQHHRSHAHARTYTTHTYTHARTHAHLPGEHARKHSRMHTHTRTRAHAHARAHDTPAGCRTSPHSVVEIGAPAGPPIMFIYIYICRRSASNVYIRRWSAYIVSARL
jgi:hypothetical protein